MNDNWTGRPRTTIAERFAWLFMVLGTIAGVIVLFAVILGLAGRIICYVAGPAICGGGQ